MGAVHRLGLEQQIVEWQGKQILNLGEGPVVTKGVGARGEHSYMASGCYWWDPAPRSWSVRRKTRQLDSATPGRARSQVAEIVG
jgi:hypothetical protein